MHVRTRTWFSFVVLASLLFIAASRFAIFDPLESAVLAVASPIEEGLRDATRPLADFVNNLTDINRLSDENQALREENERLIAENARLGEAEIELRQLQQLVELRKVQPDDSFVEAVRSTIEITPPELVADLMYRGIALAGGGALLRGLDRRLAQETKFPVYVADDPLTSVVHGTGEMLEETEMLGKVQASLASRKPPR